MANKRVIGRQLPGEKLKISGRRVLRGPKHYFRAAEANSNAEENGSENSEPAGADTQDTKKPNSNAEENGSENSEPAGADTQDTKEREKTHGPDTQTQACVSKTCEKCNKDSKCVWIQRTQSCSKISEHGKIGMCMTATFVPRHYCIDLLLRIRVMSHLMPSCECARSQLPYKRIP